MDKALVAQGVANRLFATENAVDAAICEASKLMGGIIEARHELQISAIVVDASTSKVAEAISALAEARRALIAAHGELAEAKLRAGIRTKLVGIQPKVDDENRLVSIDRQAS